MLNFWITIANGKSEKPIVCRLMLINSFKFNQKCVSYIFKWRIKSRGTYEQCCR